MILFVNCCPRENSRTKYLAEELLTKLGEYEELNLYEEEIFPLDNEKLNYRTELIEKGDYSDKMFSYAKQFANAEIIVIAAPFWDLSFPSMLKTYIENIYVTGIVSKYSENGVVTGLCKASKLYYVTTAGGVLDERFGYEYIKTLSQAAFGIKNVSIIKAEMLDVEGYDSEQILKKAANEIEI